MDTSNTTTNSPVLLYTEQTPNPESLKFVTNRMVYKGTADFKEITLAEEWSPLVTVLFDFPFVKAIYICNNYISVTKEFNYAWEDIVPQLREYIKQYIQDGKVVIKEGFAEAMEKKEAETNTEYEYTEDEAVLVKKIKELIDTYVKPAVEMDGGNIEFKSYKEGKVTVIMQGACSGCPSSTVTLKAGIEGMLKRMIPEVQEVISEMG